MTKKVPVAAKLICTSVFKEQGEIFLFDFCSDLGIFAPSQLLFNPL